MKLFSDKFRLSNFESIFFIRSQNSENSENKNVDMIFCFFRDGKFLNTFQF